MSNFTTEHVLSVHHWNERLFSFTTTRGPTLRFRNGEFIMLGLKVEGKPLLRAYSIASPNYEDRFEFFSIKVPDGALTSRLQHLREGDEIILSTKPTGTLVIDDLNPGKHLYLFATGTGLAAFLPIIQDPQTYEQFEKIVLFHGVRHIADLAYHDFISEELPQHEFLGDMVREQLIYYPAVTREDFKHRGRITELVRSGRMAEDIGLPPLDPAQDRAMICGGPEVLRDVRAMLEEYGLQISPRRGEPGDFLVERAFAER